jgi:hypothetical protein
MRHARTNSPAAKRSNAGNAGDDEHRVLPFRPRSALGSHAGRAHRADPDEEPTVSPVRDLTSYESEEAGEDNYRHRMMVNLAALVVTVVLAIAGGWLALQMAELRKKEDCVLSGRRNCMPIDVNTLER